MKEVNKCVKDLLEAKAINDSLSIDEELYELLKKISKTKNFENKYRDKATVLLNKVMHFNEYQNTIIRDNDDGLTLNETDKLLGKRVLKRSAKENVDYKMNRKRDKKDQDKKGEGGISSSSDVNS